MPGDVTELLREWAGGDESVLEELLPAVESQLHEIAAAHMRRERGDHTLQPTALMNEAYLRLVRQSRVDWRNREQFFAVAARIMRRVLVDHARRVQRLKRGGREMTISIDGVDVPDSSRGSDVLALHDALDRLSALDDAQARIVELRYFGGLTIQETARVLDVAPATVKRRWASAKAWLHREIA